MKLDDKYREDNKDKWSDNTSIIYSVLPDKNNIRFEFNNLLLEKFIKITMKTLIYSLIKYNETNEDKYHIYGTDIFDKAFDNYDLFYSDDDDGQKSDIINAIRFRS